MTTITTTPVTIHLGSATPHHYDIVRRHRSESAARQFADAQNRRTRRCYPTAHQTYEAVTIDQDGRVYDLAGGSPRLASDGYHMTAR